MNQPRTEVLVPPLAVDIPTPTTEARSILHSSFFILHSSFLLAVLCFSLFFYRLADRDLLSSHEARAAQDAQTILDESQWGLPSLFSGIPELQKPPLYYWLVAGFAHLHGDRVDAWAVRLPAALAGSFCVLALYLFGLRRGRPIMGLVAGVILASAVHYTWLARTGRIDMPLTLTVSVTLVGFYLGWKCTPLTELAAGLARRASSPAKLWFVLSYLAAAAGLLLKGPIGAVLPLAAITIFLLTEGELPAPWYPRHWLHLLHRFGLWWGIPLVAALVLPWYLWADAQTRGEFFQVFFWHHNLERGFGGSELLRAHPWWFYGPRWCLDFLPWSLFLLPACWYLFGQGRWRQDPEARFGLIWMVVMTAMLSCARFKRADYLLPAFPGAALFLGCVAERWYCQTAQPRRLAMAIGLTLVSLVIGWWIYLTWILPAYEPVGQYQRFAEEIRRQAPLPERVLFFRTEAHTLAFHVGRPLEVRVEWRDLDDWIARPGAHYVIMPLESAREWPAFVKSGRLEEVLCNTTVAQHEHGQPLVLLRTQPRP